VISDPPGPPRSLRVNDISKSSCTLTWDVPESDGGSTITGYIVEKLTGTRWIRANDKPVTECTYSVDNLIQGSDNQYRVCAENEAGIGEPSKTTDKFIPFDVPGTYLLCYYV